MRSRQQPQPRPRVNEITLKSEPLKVERKYFEFVLRENSRGRFLRIIEEGGRTFTGIIIPSAGLRDFQRMLGEMLQAADALPTSRRAKADTD
jgi:hypothetical protein